MAAQIAFFRLAADALGDDMLGFRLARTIDLRPLGLYYYVLASSTTIGEAVRRGARYCSIHNESLVLERITGDECGIRYACAGVARHLDRHQMEFWVTTLVRLTRQLTGTRSNPIQAWFIHASCAGSHELEEYFRCPVSFGAGEDKVVYPRDWEDQSIVGADPFLGELLVRYCEEALVHRARPPEALRTRIENAVTPVLPHGPVRAEVVARELGMGTRTMSRRLAAEGLTFSQVLDELRSDLARRYLEERTLPISQIAWLLGFQEVSAFTHAFKRWTGSTPTEARASVRREHDIGQRRISSGAL